VTTLLAQALLFRLSYICSCKWEIDKHICYGFQKIRCLRAPHW